MPDFDEDAHPRDEKGRFGSGSGDLKTWAEARARKEPVEREAVSPIGKVREVEPKEYSAKFEAAFKDSDFAHHVSHYSPEEMKAAGMKPLFSEDGKAGVVIKDHGDGRIEATALFNNGGAKGAGLAMLKEAIDKHGVNYVECYAGALDIMYAKLGFREASRDPFNAEYAASGWKYERFGKPDYVTMRLR